MDTKQGSVDHIEVRIGRRLEVIATGRFAVAAVVAGVASVGVGKMLGWW